jgi:biopolymer transport protein ExbD
MLRASLQAAENSHNGRLYLKVDAHARYKLVKDVLDTVPATLAQRISFLTK